MVWPIVKNIFAVVLGVVAAICIIFLIQAISNSLYPPPPDLDFDDINAVRAHVQSVPLFGKLLVLLSYAAGCLAGGAVAGIANRRSLMPALIVGGLMTFGVIMNLIAIPHPAWFAIASVVVCLPAAVIGARGLRQLIPG